MSDESEDLIQKVFIDQHGAKYPFLRVKGCNELYKIPFFPSVYTVSPDGVLISVPEDRLPNEAFIEEHLATVSLAPKMPDEPHYDGIRKLWEKKDHKKLSETLEKMLAQENLAEEVREVLVAQQAELQKRVDRQLARIQTLAQGPDFAAAQNRLEKIEKDWKGLPPAEAAKEQLAAFSKDPAIKKEIGAGKALESLLGKFDPAKVSQRKKLIEELVKFSDRFKGTHAAKVAAEERGRLVQKN
ncbi:MAG: hypothetical protein AB7I19_16585 [Planctomycetota bacterium]